MNADCNKWCIVHDGVQWVSMREAMPASKDDISAALARAAAFDQVVFINAGQDGELEVVIAALELKARFGKDVGVAVIVTNVIGLLSKLCGTL